MNLADRDRNHGSTLADGCHACVVSVSSGHRVAIPQSLREAVGWLREAESAIDCVMEWMETVPGLQLRPVHLDSSPSSDLNKEQGTDAGEADSDWRQQLRLQASKWPVKLELHGQTFRFTVPQPVRDIGLLPREQGRLVLFGYQDIMELWKPDDWYENLRHICQTARKGQD